jgi:hypothetical protein
MAAVWKFMFDYGKEDSYDKTAELYTYNTDFSYGTQPAVDVSTFKPLLAYDQFNNIRAHVLSYATYWSWLMDSTMKINNLRYSAFAPLTPELPILEGTVSISQPIVGLQANRDIYPRLTGNFLQLQWKYAWTLPENAEDFNPPRKIVRGRDTIFGVNYIGDNLPIRVGASEVDFASSARFPKLGDDPTRDYDLNDFINFVQSCHPISYTKKFTPPQWAISGVAAVSGTLYHGRSLKHQKRKGY